MKKKQQREHLIIGFSTPQYIYHFRYFKNFPEAKTNQLRKLKKIFIDFIMLLTSFVSLKHKKSVILLLKRKK